MAIARLTHLHISIPASGAPAGKVPAHCFPIVGASTIPPRPRRVSFAPDIPMPKEDVQLQFSEPVVGSDVGGSPMTDTKAEPVTMSESPVQPISPPPGFPQFSWPQAKWIPEGDASLDPGLQFVTSWSTRIIQEWAVVLSPPQLSPIMTDNSGDLASIAVGPTSNKMTAPMERCAANRVHHRHPTRPVTSETSRHNPAPAEDFLFKKDFVGSGRC